MKEKFEKLIDFLDKNKFSIHHYQGGICLVDTTGIYSLEYLGKCQAIVAEFDQQIELNKIA